MKIGLDFDGVFCDAVKMLQSGARRLYGIDLPIEECMHAHNKQLLSDEQYLTLKEIVFESNSASFKPIPLSDVQTACQTLIGRGHQLVIVTQRNEGLYDAREFLRMLDIDIPLVGMKPGQRKSSVTDGLDIFLDDSVNNLKDLLTTVPHRFLFSWSYNLEYNISECEQRVCSWQDFVQKIG